MVVRHYLSLQPRRSPKKDLDWTAAYENFHFKEANVGSGSDGDPNPYKEDPLCELGLYNCAEDISTWPFERVFADDQWQDSAIALAQSMHNFLGPTPGPNLAVALCSTDYFLRFWPPKSLQHIVEETNRYAEQPSQANVAVTNGRAGWQSLDVEELLVWFDILILMRLKEFPHIHCYWDWRPFYNCSIVSEAMLRDRFEAIIRCVHLVKNNLVVSDRSDPIYDKLDKVRWLCKSFATLSQGLYNNEVLTVDEIMVPYKGRFYNIRQYMKSKPVKFGVKVWALANSESRYVSNIIVYLGVDNARSAGDTRRKRRVLQLQFATSFVVAGGICNWVTIWRPQLQ